MPQHVLHYAQKVIGLFAESGNTNPETNASLAAAIKRARSNGVPKDNIEKSIAKVLSFHRFCSVMLCSQGSRVPEARREVIKR